MSSTEEDPYEYAVQRTSIARPDRLFIVGDYWGERDERSKVHKALSADGGPITYTFVKRLKAGKIENA